ncbi:maleylpyruvate isomerase N-terminal domain-containing protein [Cellulomonas bogoriensis]|uniref:Mycothiol-dependent maleylpyruvate isomerase metal-binding domain-containing protein n=1 Tax=Cellulomonas bogoriensis 69B4 = DSM 16987 TaxID=1386082 RepID=A0A0A0C3Q5_9CELL|nr:maleylpyruvate isomerase N-terminal domain-containing protein [Cellulomonas bogoriensis]KGM14014.1 hypothetical protein N869_06595 [Cellulomonas bogoriensis 69B4 = DSM 16987]
MVDHPAPLVHESYLAHIREDSERFIEALARTPGATPVPSCPGWTADDLTWHLAEVQHFWARVVAGDAPDEVRPPDRSAGLEPAEALARAGTELLTVLHEKDPQAPCWSWFPGGGTVAWVARRQAHEALVHRADAQLTAGLEVAPPAVELAVDGVDEALRVIGAGAGAGAGTGAPFVADGTTVRLVCSNAPQEWTVALGTAGEGPDAPATLAVLAEDDGGPDTATVTGPAWELDLWLWGRATGEQPTAGHPTAGHLTTVGDTAAADRVRAVVARAGA